MIQGDGATLQKAGFWLSHKPYQAAKYLFGLFGVMGYLRDKKACGCCVLQLPLRYSFAECKRALVSPNFHSA